MLSAKRIIEIFRTRGGGEDFIRPFDTLPPEQLTHVRTVAKDEPIVAKVSSAKEWFVLTKTHFVVEQPGRIVRVSFNDIHSVDIPKQDFMNPRIKVEGGNLDLVLRNGASVRVNIRPGGPYFGLMNVLMRLAKINCRRNSNFKAGDHNASPMTNDRRPTTQL